MNNKQFKKAFSILLEEDLKMSDKEAMASTLDKGSTPEDFDVDLTPDTKIPDDSDLALKASQDLVNVVSGQNAVMIETLKGWINKIEDFVSFLNATEGDSIQVALSKSIPDTLFDKIRIAESKKISRSAIDLAALGETFRSYVSAANDAKLRFS